jgi:hypothetical protein
VSGPEFFQTSMGKRFYEHTMPELVRQVGRLAEALEGILAAMARAELRKGGKQG